jgi:ArsR family transcriptional regulator
MTDRQLYRLHAGICHALAHPKRLEIIDKLGGRELSVSELVRALEISQGNLSQHLAIMRQRGIVRTRRKGLSVFYRLSSPKITRACDLMRQVLLEHLEDSTRAVAKTSAEKRVLA